MSAPGIPTPAQLAEAAYWIRGTQMSFVAWYAVTLWDWVINLPREWRLIHKTPWSVVKVLYLLCRYWVIACMPFILWVFIADHSEEDCQRLFRVPEFIAMWHQKWAEGVLIVRVYAFWGHNRPLLVALCGTMVCIIAFQLWCVIKGVTLLPFLNPPHGPCFPTVTFPGSTIIMDFFLCTLVFDTVLTCLTLYRAFQLRIQTAGGAASNLMKTFVREGLFYFILISGANLVNAIFYWQPKVFMSGLNIPLSTMFPDILACRLILDLRESGKATAAASNPQASYSLTHRRIAPKMPTAPQNPRRTNVHDDDSSQGIVTAMGFKHELSSFDGARTGGRSVTVVTPKGGGTGSDLDFKNNYDIGSGGNNAQAIRVDIESHHYFEPSDEEKSEKGRSVMP